MSFVHGKVSTAIALCEYESTHIPRPLALPDFYHTTLQFYIWNTPGAFARTFRVASKEQLELLWHHLRIPQEVYGTRIDANGQTRLTYRANGVDALAVAMARLAYACRLDSLAKTLHLNWSEGKMSSIIKAVVQALYDRWRQRALFDQRVFADHARLRLFANAIKALGCPFDDCVGFIDGTTLHVCRPGGNMINQALFYSGHKRVHCVRWQGVVTPDGMLASFYGPTPGASNDAGLLNLSKLDDTLRALFGPHPTIPNVSKFLLYGDSGYSGGHRLTIYTPADLATQQLKEAANSVRVAVENVFGAKTGTFSNVYGGSRTHFSYPDSVSLSFPLVGQWAFTKYAQNLNVRLSPVAAQMLVGALLYNCVNCLNPGLVSKRFGVDPPTLVDYLQ
jgi:hypothetical protein